MAVGSKNNKGQRLSDSKNLVFQFFNEVGIINQLSSALLNKRLPDGLHISHFSVLNHMVRLGDGKTPLELASAFQVSKGTMTHTLSTLEKRKLVILTRHPTDGRSKVVHITDEGRAFQKQAIESIQPMVETIAGKIDWDAVASFMPELQNIREVLDNNRDL